MSKSQRPAARPRISRRLLVRRGLLLGGLSAAAGTGVLLWGHGGRYPEAEPAVDLVYLDRRAFSVVASLSDALFPPGSALGISGRQARVPEYVDRMLARMPSNKAQEFVAMLLVFEHGTLAFGLRVRRFPELPQDRAEKYLRRWEEAQVYSRRILAAALKTTLGIAYFAHPDVQEKLGMQRTCAAGGDIAEREEWR